MITIFKILINVKKHKGLFKSFIQGSVCILSSSLLPHLSDFYSVRLTVSIIYNSCFLKITLENINILKKHYFKHVSWIYICDSVLSKGDNLEYQTIKHLTCLSGRHIVCIRMFVLDLILLWALTSKVVFSPFIGLCVSGQ